MICNFSFYRFVSSSLFFGFNGENLWLLLKIKKGFPCFVLTLFWCSTSYTVIIVLRKFLLEPVNAHALWWHYACLNFGYGLRRLGKTWDFLRRIHVNYLVLKFCSDINDGNWLQLPFYFIVLMGILASVSGKSFFQQCFRF